MATKQSYADFRCRQSEFESFLCRLLLLTLSLSKDSKIYFECKGLHNFDVRQRCRISAKRLNCYLWCQSKLETYLHSPNIWKTMMLEWVAETKSWKQWRSESCVLTSWNSKQKVIVGLFFNINCVMLLLYIYIYIYLARTPEIGQGLGRILSCGARKTEQT